MSIQHIGLGTKPGLHSERSVYIAVHNQHRGKYFYNCVNATQNSLMFNQF